MGKVHRRRAGRWIVASALVLVVVLAGVVFAEVRATYLYTLANFSGQIRYDAVRLSVDQERDEVYFIYQNLVRIFNASGMEIFSFGDDLDLGHIVDVAVDRNGDIILLSSRDSRSLVTRCNFRGVPAGAIEITNLPAGLAFAPNRMVFRNGKFYFASLATSSVIITGADGAFDKHIDLLSLLGADGPGGGADIVGFTVNQDGDIIFTVPTQFKVYKLSNDGKITSFGRAGSIAGRFGVIAGVASDSQGNLFVTDKLKCVVMMFDKDFKFLTEFGYRGPRPENLIAPDAIVTDRRDRLYVSQARSRGVSVFALTRD